MANDTGIMPKDYIDTPDDAAPDTFKSSPVAAQIQKAISGSATDWGAKAFQAYTGTQPTVPPHAEAGAVPMHRLPTAEDVKLAQIKQESDLHAHLANSIPAHFLMNRGGSAMPKTYMVGEKGPEILQMNAGGRGGYVMPLHRDAGGPVGDTDDQGQKIYTPPRAKNFWDAFQPGGGSPNAAMPVTYNPNASGPISKGLGESFASSGWMGTMPGEKPQGWSGNASSPGWHPPQKLDPWGREKVGSDQAGGSDWRDQYTPGIYGYGAGEVSGPQSEGTFNGRNIMPDYWKNSTGPGSLSMVPGSAGGAGWYRGPSPDQIELDARNRWAQPGYAAAHPGVTPGYQKSYWDAHPDEYAASNAYDMVRPPDPYGFEGQQMKFKMQGLQDIANDPYRPPAAKAAATAQIHQMLSNLGSQSATAAQVGGHVFGNAMDARSKSDVAQYAHWAQTMGLPAEIAEKYARANQLNAEAGKGYAVGDQGMVMNGRFYPNPGKYEPLHVGDRGVIFNSRSGNIGGVLDDTHNQFIKAIGPELVKMGFQHDMMGNVNVSSPAVQLASHIWRTTGQPPKTMRDPKTGRLHMDIPDEMLQQQQQMGE